MLTYKKKPWPLNHKKILTFTFFCTCANSHCQGRYCACVITVQRTLKVALSHRLRPSLGLTTTLSELCRANLLFLYSCTKRFNSMRRKGKKKNARELLACMCVVQTEIPKCIVLSGCQLDDCIFQSGLNFANLTR